MTDRRQVAIVVDAATEISREQLQRLGIFVVPRSAKLGRETAELSQEQPLGSLISKWKNPQAIKLSNPETTTWIDTYERAMRRCEHVLSFHLPIRLDDAVKKGRQARNLSAGTIHLIEYPQAGIGLAKAIEAVAFFAEKGWGLNELLLWADRLPRLVRTLFVSPTGLRPNKLISGGPGLQSLLNRSAQLVTEIDSEHGQYHVQAHLGGDELIAYLVKTIAQCSQEQKLAYSAEIRTSASNLPFVEQLTQTLNRHAVPTTIHKDWPVHLHTHLGKNAVEICMTPSAKDLIDRGYEEKHLLETAYRFEPTQLNHRQNGRQRLSDYKIKSVRI